MLHRHVASLCQLGLWIGEQLGYVEAVFLEEEVVDDLLVLVAEHLVHGFSHVFHADLGFGVFEADVGQSCH